jgi:hypothetical protein
VALFALFWAYALHSPVRYLITRGILGNLPARHPHLH